MYDSFGGLKYYRVSKQDTLDLYLPYVRPLCNTDIRGDP